MSVQLALLAALLGPGDGIPGRVSVRTSPAGLVVHGDHPAARVVVRGPDAQCPEFSPPGAAAGECVQVHDQLARWDGYMPGDGHGRHTVIGFTPAAALVDVWLLGPNGVFGPWVSSWPAACAGDWNLDRRVDSRDISAFLADWLAPPPPGYDGEILRGDFDCDGVAGVADISAFLSAWLASVQECRP